MVAVVQSIATTGGPGGGLWLSTFAAPVAAGNTLFLAVFAYSNSAVTITADTTVYNGSPYAASALFAVNSPDTNRVFIGGFMFAAVPGGGTTLGATCHNGNVDNFVGSIAYEVSGLGAVPAVDVHASNSGGAGNIDSGPAGPASFAPDFVLGAANGFALAQANAPGFTNLLTGSGNASSAGYQITSSPGGTFDYATNTGVGVDWAAAVSAVHAPAAGSGDVKRHHRAGRGR